MTPDLMPMFPLGSVLFPGAILPLHVFEPRYRELVKDCLANEREFGVVLIERGSEVGGGDIRTSVGTRAAIAQANEVEPGRWMVIAVGLRRIRVREWAADDPYPMARCEDWPDEPSMIDPDQLAATLIALRKALALASELGEHGAGFDLELSDVPDRALFQACAAAPLGPADLQQLLVAPNARDRLSLLIEHLRDQTELLEARLSTPE